MNHHNPSELCLQELKDLNDKQFPSQAKFQPVQSLTDSSKSLPSETHSTPSQNLLEYLEFMFPSLNLSNCQNAAELAKKLVHDQIQLSHIQQKITQNQLFIKCFTFYSEPTIILVRPTKFYEAVTLTVHYGFYKTQIHILNYASKDFDVDSITNRISFQGKGSYGQIYYLSENGKPYAVKYTEFPSNCGILSEKINYLMKTIREYFFLLLFSQLEIGPKIHKIFGFDLILSKNGIEFSMQKCEELKFSNDLITHSLKEDLKTMHMLQIAHRDIKPQNIMYSKEFKKPVFIDFGGSLFLSQKIGCKSYTRFAGTAGFCSTEMLKIVNQGYGYVDLYSNDAKGLQKTIIENDKQLKNGIMSVLMSCVLQGRVMDILEISQAGVRLVKYFLFQKNYEKAYQIYRKLSSTRAKDIQQISLKILKFLIEFSVCKQTYEFYKLLEDQYGNSQQLSQIHNFFTQKLSNIFGLSVDFARKKQMFANQIKLYKLLRLQNQNITLIEHNLSNILISQQTVEKYIESVLTDDTSVVNPDNNKVMFPIIGLYYCSLFCNKFKISLDQKIDVAKKILAYLQKNNLWSQNHQELIFECQQKDLSTPAALFQYILTNNWRQIPQNFKYDCLQQLIGSLALLGFPFYINQAKWIFIYFFFDLKSSDYLSRFTDGTFDESSLENANKFQKKMEDAILVWKCLGTTQKFRELFGSKKAGNLKISRNTRIPMVKRAQQFVYLLLHFIEGAPDLWGSKNRQTFSLILKFNLLTKEETANLDEILQKNKILLPKDRKINWDQINQSLLLIIMTMDDTLPMNDGNFYFLNDQQKKRRNIQNYVRGQVFFSKMFRYFIRTFGHNHHYEEMKKCIEQMDDELIPDERLNERMFIEKRMLIAWKNKDIHRFNRLCEIVDNECLVSYLNLLNIVNIMGGMNLVMTSSREDNIGIRNQFKFFGYLIIEKIFIHKLKDFLILFRKAENVTDALDGQVDSSVEESQSPQNEDLLEYSQYCKLSMIEKCMAFQGLFLTAYKKVIQEATITPQIESTLFDYFKKNNLQQIFGTKTYNQFKLMLNFHSKINQIQILQKQNENFIRTKLMTYKFKYVQNKQGRQIQMLVHRAMLEIQLSKRIQPSQQISLIQKDMKQQGITIQQIIQRGHSKSILTFCFYYLGIKIKTQQDTDISVYLNLIMCYNLWISQSNFYQFLFPLKMFDHLFDAFLIVDRSGFKGVETFLRAAGKNLTLFPDVNGFLIFYERLKEKLIHEKNHKLTRSGKTLGELVEYLEFRMGSYDSENDAGMSLVFMTLINNNWLEGKLARKLFMFIGRTRDFMDPRLKLIIESRIWVLGLVVRLSIVELRRKESIAKDEYNGFVYGQLKWRFLREHNKVTHVDQNNRKDKVIKDVKTKMINKVSTNEFEMVLERKKKMYMSS